MSTIEFIGVREMRVLPPAIGEIVCRRSLCFSGADDMSNGATVAVLAVCIESTGGHQFARGIVSPSSLRLIEAWHGKSLPGCSITSVEQRDGRGGSLAFCKRSVDAVARSGEQRMTGNRRKSAALGGAGAAIAASSVALARGHHGGPLGLSADFWRGVPIGIGIVMIVAALVLLSRRRAG